MVRPTCHPAGKVFQGVATKPVSAYASVVHKHPAVYQEFVAWGQWLPGITADATANHARMMMEITTAFGSSNKITPQGIADGNGDAWLIGLAQQIASSGNVTYIRLMAEMNNCNNPYAAYNCNGSSRGSAFLIDRVQTGLAACDADLPAAETSLRSTIS